MQIPSKYLENATEQIASLPGIGKKTALRLALNLLQRSEIEISDFTKAILELKSNLVNCKSCGNISDDPVCSICINPSRDHSIVCVVEDIRDVMAIESTSTFKGVYHVLGGLISPMDGIGPSDLNIDNLVLKAASSKLIEVIFALSSTMEGETTNFYLFKKLQAFEILITTLSRGISVGSELQYADEVTLGRSMQHRQPFQLDIK
jgi:recombination protein RecR